MSDQSVQRPQTDYTQHSKETAAHARAGFEHADLGLIPRGLQDMPKSYTAGILMELDPSGLKNSIIDVCTPTNIYIA